LEGTSLQLDAWRLGAATDWGTLISYADVARAIGRPGAHRGVAAAMGRSPLSLLIPAHRVIGADGRLKGADTGNPMRARLLRFEGHRL
jgi:methylated-DNA-[protein]-cysteine S-methyltransferase